MWASDKCQYLSQTWSFSWACKKLTKQIQFKTKFSNEISSFESGYINLSNKFDTSDPTDRILGQIKNLLVAPSSLAKSRSLIPLCTQQTGQEYFALKRLTVACGFWRLCVCSSAYLSVYCHLHMIWLSSTCFLTCPPAYVLFLRAMT